MQRALLDTKFLLLVSLMAALFIAGPLRAHAQTATDTQLRATIQAEVMADPRSQTMSQVQINALVDSLTSQAEAQGITASELTYRPIMPSSETTAPARATCTTFSCTISKAFGLDGSIPIIPIGLFVAAALFILIYSLMREMGHPHTQA